MLWNSGLHKAPRGVHPHRLYSEVLETFWLCATLLPATHAGDSPRKGPGLRAEMLQFYFSCQWRTWQISAFVGLCILTCHRKIQTVVAQRPVALTFDISCFLFLLRPSYILESSSSAESFPVTFSAASRFFSKDPTWPRKPGSADLPHDMTRSPSEPSVSRAHP